MNSWALGAFRIQSIGAELMPLLLLRQQREKFIIYRKEMTAFTAFLYKTYLHDL